MPIRFRCTYCNRLLGIASRKAGTDTVCPHCGYAITVPYPEDESAQTERLDLGDVDELMGNGATERLAEPKTRAVPPPPVPAVSARHVEKPRAENPKPPPVPKAPSAIRPQQPAPKPAAQPSDEPPLFEGDMDAILGKTAAPAEEKRPRPAPTSGPDAMSLGEPPRMLVISATKATILALGVAVLLALAFAAGYFLALKT